MAKVRRCFVALLVVCVTTTCTRSKPRLHVEQAVSTTDTMLSPAEFTVVTAATSSNDTAVARRELATYADLTRAMRAHDYELARELAALSQPALTSDTLSLLRGFLALQNADPQRAMEYFGALGPGYGELAPWRADLRADALAMVPSYVDHLSEITARPSYHRLIAVTERLLGDKRFALAERTLALAHKQSVGVGQSGEVRWLRARLRLAAGRAATAQSDIRWLLVMHPEHPRSNDALAAVSRGDFGALSTTELLARAEAAAEKGLVDVVDQSITAGLAISPVCLSDGEQAYLRGVALYRARRFAEAITPLDHAVATLAARRERARYLAASSASRAGAGEDALRRFIAIARHKPVTENVENATFLVAREHSLLGNWADASEHYTRFIAEFPNHELAEAAHRDRLITWFGEGNYKRFVYWVRQFRRDYPRAKEALLLRGLEALALYRLGHAEQARPLWEDLARAAPLAFAGIVARQRLAELGFPVDGPIKRAENPQESSNVRLPELIQQLELAGLSEQSEAVFRRLEPSLTREYAPKGPQALCQASARLERGRRRFELGRTFASQRGVKDAPQLAPAWLWPCWFPTPHRESVTLHAGIHGVEPSLIYAVMRQESAFLVDATSAAGAHGLMQIITPTARRIAADLGRSYEQRSLNVAHHNIEFGAFYLRKLQAHFRHPALVAAAYNAGPEATARWYAAGRTLPLEAFIARIPYDETRSYVQRVLENLVAYRALLDGELPAVSLDLPPLAHEATSGGTTGHLPDGFY